jgi:hypothetical protein
MAAKTKAEAVPTARVLGEGVAAVYLPVDALKPNPRNPRIHGAEVTKLARTILRTTWGAPVIAQASTLRIIGGHGRLEAAKLILAGFEVDGILRGGADHRFDRGAPGPALVPVRLVDVSDAEAEAMTLADNASALQGRDDASLAVEMATRSFERNAPLMADMGYGADDLDRMVRAAGDAVLAATQGDPAAAFGALPDGDKQPFQQMTFTLHDSQADTVRRALDAAKDAGDFDGSPNENSNGNALARMAEAFLG